MTATGSGAGGFGVPHVFDHFVLDDSYLLGIVTDGPRLRLRVMFAVDPAHPAYRSPLSGEQHCYREGDIVVDGLHIEELRRPVGRPSILIDPDGTLDLGGIAVARAGLHYVVATEWFELTFDAASIAVQLG